MTTIPFADMTLDLTIKGFYIPLNKSKCYHLIFFCDNKIYKKIKFTSDYIKLFGEV